MSAVILRLARSDRGDEASLRLPATEEEVDQAIESLTVHSNDVGSLARISNVLSPVSNLKQYIWGADIERSSDLQKLNELAELIYRMDERQVQTFSGALDAECINGLDDVLRVAEHLDDYIILPNITSDIALGRFLVDTGYKNFPETVQPYLDYRAIGAEYYTEHGGAYGPSGYVRRRSSLEQITEERPALITVHLRTLEVSETMGEAYRLSLPATDEELDRAKDKLDVDHFTDAFITKIEFGEPYLEELIPLDCFCVEDANELALSIEEMQQKDGELLKYLAVLSVLQPDTLAGALDLAMDLDDYEKVTKDTYEYGKQVLRRIGAGDEIIDTIDGYMDFEKFGDDSMVEDGVRQTEFGLIRRCSHPFPAQVQGQQMGGMM